MPKNVFDEMTQGMLVGAGQTPDEPQLRIPQVGGLAGALISTSAPQPTGVPGFSQGQQLLTRALTGAVMPQVEQKISEGLGREYDTTAYRLGLLKKFGGPEQKDIARSYEDARSKYEDALLIERGLPPIWEKDDRAYSANILEAQKRADEAKAAGNSMNEQEWLQQKQALEAGQAQFRARRMVESTQRPGIFLEQMKALETKLVSPQFAPSKSELEKLQAMSMEEERAGGRVPAAETDEWSEKEYARLQEDYSKQLGEWKSVLDRMESDKLIDPTATGLVISHLRDLAFGLKRQNIHKAYAYQNAWLTSMNSVNDRQRLDNIVQAYFGQAGININKKLTEIDKLPPEQRKMAAWELFYDSTRMVEKSPDLLTNGIAAQVSYDNFRDSSITMSDFKDDITPEDRRARLTRYGKDLQSVLRRVLEGAYNENKSGFQGAVQEEGNRLLKKLNQVSVEIPGRSLLVIPGIHMGNIDDRLKKELISGDFAKFKPIPGQQITEGNRTWMRIYRSIFGQDYQIK